MSPVRVLLTLSDPAASAAALAAAGFRVETVRVLHIAPTGAAPPAAPGALLVTSAHAAAWVPPGLAAVVVAVGARTAAALVAAGHPSPRVAGGDGADALRLLEAANAPQPWVFAGADAPAPAVAAAIAAGTLHHWPVYRSVPDPSAWGRIAALPPPDIVVLGSPRVAREVLGAPALAAARVVAIGATTGAACAEAGRPPHAVAAAPTPAGLRAAVEDAAAGLSRRSAWSGPS